MILSEQGYGDTIWASRYLPRVKALGGTLILEARKDLIPLMASLNIADRIIAKGDPLPKADRHIHVCSLPALYAPSIESISGSPYISPPKGRIEKANAAIGDAGDKLKVGIVWSGSTTFKANQDRAVPLRSFLDAFLLPGIQLYSLQKGPPAAELKNIPATAIKDLGPAMADFADAAAIVSQLDLIIMTDSAVAHLAGAMGKPVWVLLNHGAYWLWLDRREDSPWYESMRLFRPKVWNDWTGVFDAAAAALIGLSIARTKTAASATPGDDTTRNT